MILESLIIGLCFGGWECDSAPRAYYLYNKDLQVIVKQTELKAKDIAGPFMVDYMIPYSLPLIMVANGKEGTVKITKNVSFTANKDKVRVSWQFNF